MAIHGYLHNVGPRYVRPLTSALPSSTSAWTHRRCRCFPPSRPPFASDSPPPPWNPSTRSYKPFSTRGPLERGVYTSLATLMQRCFIAARRTLSGDQYYFYAVIITWCNDTCRGIYTDDENGRNCPAAVIMLFFFFRWLARTTHAEIY